jgi:hypothetical protein
MNDGDDNAGLFLSCFFVKKLKGKEFKTNAEAFVLKAAWPSWLVNFSP